MFELTNNIPLPYLLLGAGVLLFVYNTAIRIHRDARIRKLGARAPTRTAYLPWSVDMAYDVVTYAMKDEIYEMWVSMFAKFARPGQYTVEAGVGERVILTAEPENIKATASSRLMASYGTTRDN
jgi:hypothetical protein